MITGSILPIMNHGILSPTEAAAGPRHDPAATADKSASLNHQAQRPSAGMGVLSDAIRPGTTRPGAIPLWTTSHRSTTNESTPQVSVKPGKVSVYQQL